MATDTQKEKDEEVQISPLDMSDEDILDKNEDSILAASNSDDAKGSEGVEDSDDSTDTSDAEDDEDDNKPEETEESDVNKDSDEDNNKESDDKKPDPDSDDDSGDDKTTDDEDKSAAGKSDDSNKESGDTESKDPGLKKKSKKAESINFESEYKKILAPFRANGKELSVGSVDDAIALMKMGANYNKKMAGLKPNLKLMKMLENNNLLDEAKLSFLIDLDKKNPEAVAKFMKDADIDPMDIDTDDATKYKPKTYTVNDKEVELDTVLDEIQDTKSFNTTIDIISNKWDPASKKVILDSPDIIKTINDHVESGIYEQIDQVVQSERMLGRLTGVSDIEAYKQIGDKIQAAGGFKQSNTDEGTTTAANRESKTKLVSKLKKEDPELKSRKRAAGSTKSSPAKSKQDFNPLAVSDEEFEKIAASQFM